MVIESFSRVAVMALENNPYLPLRPLPIPAYVLQRRRRKSAAYKQCRESVRRV
jgi:hypothetical protein